MLHASPEVYAILIHRGAHATAYVVNPAGGEGLFPVRLVRSVEEAFEKAQDSGPRAGVIIVDVDSIGVREAREIVDDLANHPSRKGVPIVAWVRREDQATRFSGSDAVPVKSPANQRDRYSQIGGLVAACQSGLPDALRKVADESFKSGTG